MRILKYAATVVALCAGPAITAADDSVPVTSFDQLLKLLEDDSVTHQTQRDSQIVLIPVAKAPIDSTMLIRWAAEDDGVVHFVQTMDLEVPEKRLDAVREAVLRMNHASPVPGLGVNPDARVLYYRMSPTTAPSGGLTAGKIRTCFRHTLNQAAAIHGVMKDVIEGHVAAENVVAAYNQSAAEATPIPAGRYEVTLQNETWKLTFDDEGTVKLYRGDEEVVESSCMTEGTRVTFIDRTGAFKVSEPGIYEWRFMEGKLQFRTVKDSSRGREMILTSAAWTRR